MGQTADIVIAGGGIIGMSIAFQLSRRKAGNVIVLDKGMGPGEGSTGASSAVCRAKYSINETVELARDGINAYRHWREYLELPAPLARLNADGVLWMSDGGASDPHAEIRRLSSLGISVALLDDAALAERFPALNPCIKSPDFLTGEPHPCRAGGLHLLEAENGYVDPVDALQDLIAAARARGVEVRFRSEVADIETRGGRIAGVVLASGERIACGTLVNCAGPWCQRLFDLANVNNPWPFVPTRIQVMHVDRPPSVTGPIPACADPLAGIYFRSQNRGAQIIVGSVREEDEREAVADPDSFDRGVDQDFVASKLFALQHRIRGLEAVRSVKGYSGLYTMNRADLHPVVGATPLPGFYVANGFSGHGFKLAPAIGSLIAQAIAGPADAFDTSVDIAFLGFNREPIKLESWSVLA